MTARDRADIRRLLLESRAGAERHIKVIKETIPLSHAVLHEELVRYILAKFLLTDRDLPESDSFDELTKRSLAASQKISSEMVAVFDAARSCDGATSVMTKKVLLYLAIQRELGIELPTTESARVKTLHDLSGMVWKTMARDPVWKVRQEER